MKTKRLYISLFLIGLGFYSHCHEKKPDRSFFRPTFSVNYYASANQYLLVSKYQKSNNYEDIKTKNRKQGRFYDIAFNRH